MQHLLFKHHEISYSKTVIYCWIPSHIGIYGNGKVDKNAKESLNLDQIDFKIPFNNLNLLSTNTSLTNGKVHGTKHTPFTQLLPTRVRFTNAGVNTYGAEMHKVRKHAIYAFPSFLFLIFLFRLYVKEPFSEM